jgi:hypothetical protein
VRVLQRKSVGNILMFSWATGCVATFEPASKLNRLGAGIAAVFSSMRIGHRLCEEPAVVDESPSRTRPLEPSIDLFWHLQKEICIWKENSYCRSSNE